MAEISHTGSSGAGRIVVDRPVRKNAFTPEMADAWAGYLIEARADPEVRAVVETATSDGFCSDGDLGVLNPAGGGAPAYERRAQLSERTQRVALATEDFDKPVLAGVDGVAAGAGLDMELELLLGADFGDAAEAQRIGLVNRICEDGEAATEVVRLASRLGSVPALAVRTIKRTVYQSGRVDLRTALDLVSSHVGVLYSAAGTAEAIAAVRAHRTATFEGR